MFKKIFITGPVGSGKSTLGRKISSQYHFSYCELDSIVYKPDPSSPTGNKKRPEEERTILLNAVLSNSKWVVEDTGRACFETVWRKADSIILLEPPVPVRKYRIVLRWIKQMLRIEKCGYTPGLYMLKLMFKWTKNYESGADSVKERLIQYRHKVSILRTEKDIHDYISENLTED